jgi:hypothetical protein
MIQFPECYVKTKYPGYFWNRDTQTLFSIKVGGFLKEMKYQSKAMIIHGRYRSFTLEPGYRVSVRGERYIISLEELKRLNKKPDKIEFVDNKSVLKKFPPKTTEYKQRSLY